MILTSIVWEGEEEAKTSLHWYWLEDEGARIYCYFPHEYFRAEASRNLTKPEVLSQCYKSWPLCNLTWRIVSMYTMPSYMMGQCVYLVLYCHMVGKYKVDWSTRYKEHGGPVEVVLFNNEAIRRKICFSDPHPVCLRPLSDFKTLDRMLACS